MSSGKQATTENIYRLDGLSKVFKFTFLQTLKSKSYRVSFIIFVLVMVMQKPINYFMSKSGHEASDKISNEVCADSVEKIYFANESGIPLDMDEMLTDLAENGKENVESPVSQKFVAADKTADELAAGLSPKECAVIVTLGETGFDVKGVVSDGTEVSVSDVDSLVSFTQWEIEKTKEKMSGLTEDDIKLIQSGVSVESLQSYTEYMDKSEEAGVSKGQFAGYILTFSIIIFLVSSMGTSYIIASVTEEKTSKLVESLLVSVRPMALLLGKIFGMMAYVVMTLATGLIGAKIVDIVMFDVVKLEQVKGTEAMFDFGILTKFGPGATVLFIATLLLGFMTFGIIAGMLGSACSQTEDVQAATGTVMWLSMAGYFGAMILSGMSASWVPLVLALVPPLTFFALPVLFVCGKISVGVLACGIAIQIALVLIFAWIMARTYRNLLLADTSKPKLKTIFKAMKA